MFFFSPGDKVRLSNGQVGVWQSEKGSRFAVEVDGIVRVYFKDSVSVFPVLEVAA